MTEGKYRDVQCPFYKKHKSVEIRCEGTAENNRLVISFTSKTDMIKYMDEHCYNFPECMKCLVYKALMEKYK